MSAYDASLIVRPVAAAPRRREVWMAYEVERRKLSSQLAPRLLALLCLVGPFAFAGLLEAQSGSPSDTLYGGWVHASGFAVSLVVLGFAGSWGFPLIAGILAGDVFASEDRYGTWKLLLTRSCTRGSVFLAKLLAAGTFSLLLVGLTAISSLLAGLVFVGDQPLISLSGTSLSPGSSLALVLLSWLLCVLPTLAFVGVAVLASIATRNGIAGVLAPAVAALVMQLLLLVGSGIWAHMVLVALAFNAWHALFAVPRFYGALGIAMLVSIVWIGLCVGGAWLILRRRDFAGTTVARRVGWRVPAGALAATIGLISLLAFAGNWGPVGITAARVRASFVPAFNRLVVLQQKELGHTVVPGAKLEVARPSCNRLGTASRGPGDWVCTLSVLIPTEDSLTSDPTTIAYDLSLQSDGCYKAQAPPLFFGQQLMHDASGHQVANPLYTIYGCFNTL